MTIEVISRRDQLEALAPRWEVLDAFAPRNV
jgi:hypothetical protein